MLPAAMFAAAYSRLLERASPVSSIVSQMAVLMNEKLSTDVRTNTMTKQLDFWLIKPTDRWSDVQVRVWCQMTPEDKPVCVFSIPPHIQQPLETSLRSLGYTVEIENSSFSPPKDAARIAVSWAK
jgi:hypothetical protein